MPAKSSSTKGCGHRRKLSRTEQKKLDVQISFLEGLVKRDPSYIDALQILGDDYTSRGRFLSGLKIDERLAELRPGDPIVFYNLACSYCLTGKLVRAAEALKKALALGYRDFTWLARDPDLRRLRQHRLYATIQTQLRRLRIRVR
jgi:tetratricopeptide (TPR) repeat protein